MLPKSVALGRVSLLALGIVAAMAAGGVHDMFMEVDDGAEDSLEGDCKLEAKSPLADGDADLGGDSVGVATPRKPKRDRDTDSDEEAAVDEAGDSQCAICLTFASDDISFRESPLVFVRVDGPFVLCSLCHGHLRIFGGGSRHKSKQVQQITRNPAARMSYVEQVAMTIALARMSNAGSSRPQSATLLERVAFVKDYTDILQTFRAAREEPRALHSPVHVVPFAEYVSTHGNPLTNGHAIVEGLLNNAVRLVCVGPWSAKRPRALCFVRVDS
jgi:hypothetical protein